MGSQFFQSMWEGPAAFFGSQSGLGKSVYNDPINRATGNMIVQPNGTYGSKGPPAQPSIWNGVTPTLAAANAGYPQPGQSNSPNMTGQQPPKPVQGVSRRPSFGGW